LLTQRHGQKTVSPGRCRVALVDLAAYRLGLPEAPCVDEDRGQVVSRRQVIRGRRDACPVLAFGFVESVEPMQHAPQIVARLRLLRLDVQRLAVTGKRIQETVLLAQHIAKIEPDERRIGETICQFAQHGLRVAEVALHRDRIRNAKLEVGIARIEVGCLTEGFFGFSKAPGCKISLRQIAEHTGMIAQLSGSTLEVIRGLTRVAELEPRGAQQVERVRMIRGDRQGFGVGVASRFDAAF